MARPRLDDALHACRLVPPPGIECAGCLRPVEEPVDGNIPTIAFVSFWAGPLLAAYHLRHAAGQDALAEQHLSAPARASVR